MMKVSMRLRGLEETLRAIGVGGTLWRHVMTHATQGMIENTEDLLGRAMRDAPLDEGTLRGSGNAAVYIQGKAVARSGFAEVGDEAIGPEIRQIIEGGGGHNIVGVVGFNTPYALAQHERLDYQHPKGGKAKYLEDNLKEHERQYQGNLDKHVAKALLRWHY